MNVPGVTNPQSNKLQEYQTTHKHWDDSTDKKFSLKGRSREPVHHEQISLPDPWRWCKETHITAQLIYSPSHSNLICTQKNNTTNKEIQLT